MINTRIKLVVQLHNVLHGFHTGRGEENDLMDIKLAHYLESMYQDPLFLVFLYLSKSHDNLDQERII